MERESEDSVEEVAGVKCEKETKKAILAVLPGGLEKWIPKSVITEDSEVYKAGTDGKLVVKRWFAEKEGIG